MAAELIGFENLPNVFIKEISIYDYKENENKIRVSLSLQDDLQVPVWYDTSAVLTQLLQVGIIFTSDEQEILNLNSGVIDFNSNNMMVKSLGKNYEENGYIYFDLTFENVFPKSIRNLNVYSFCYISKRSILQTHGFELENNYYGPIKGEVIYSNGFLERSTFVFLTDNEDYWPGPVHSMGNNFMIGSYHNQNREKFLRRIRVKNTKIKDYTSIRNTSLSSKEQNQNIFSDLMISYNSNTDINSIFMLNVRSLLKNKTRYGGFLKRASRF